MTMKKLGRSVTIIVFSLFISSLLLLSASARFADAGGPYAALKQKQMKTYLAPAPIHSDSSLSKKYLDTLLVGEFALNRGDLKTALENYSWVAKESQDPKISRRATEIALLSGSLPLAQREALLWAKTDPKNLEAKLTSAAILIQANNLKQAFPFLKQIEELKPQDAYDQFLLLYKQFEDPTVQSRLIGLLEQLNSKNAYLALSEIYLFQSQTEKALENSQKTLQIDPNLAQGIILYTQSLVANHQLDKAQKFLDAQLQKQPNNVPLQFFYIQFYERQGALDKAKKQLSSLAKRQDLNPSELFVLARLSMEAKSLDQAESLLKRLEKTSLSSEQSDLARYFLGKLSELQTKPKQAIEWYQKVENPPFYGISHIRASLIYNDLKDPTKALEILDNMETAPEDERPVTLAKIEILASVQQYHKALTLVEGLLEGTPSDIELQSVRTALKKKIAEGQSVKSRGPALVKER